MVQVGQNGGSMNTARAQLAASNAGLQTAALHFGGRTAPVGSSKYRILEWNFLDRS
jgi:hypothetical protein